MTVFDIEGTFLLIVAFVLLSVKIFAFVNSLMFSGESYAAAGKLTKPAWCTILGIGMAFQLLTVGSPMNLLNVAFTIAAFVYLADVRPALTGLRRR